MRQIIPEQNLVYLDDDESYPVDCSILVSDNITYVGEDEAGLWIEKSPFTGRIRDFNAAPVNLTFDRAVAARNDQAPSPETLTEAKARRKSDVDALRDQKIAAGFEYAFPDRSGTIQLRSQKDISNVQGVASAGQALAATGDTTTALNFRDAEDITHTLTAPELIQMGLAVAGFISNHYSAAWSHKDAISGFSTIGAIDSHDITTGWPANA